MYVYKEEGETTNCSAKDVGVQRKKVVACTVESDERGKTGTQPERSLSLEIFEDSPDISRQAKFMPVRVRDEISGKYVMEEHC